jgi:Flp pilus assembly protein protease CpaA
MSLPGVLLGQARSSSARRSGLVSCGTVAGLIAVAGAGAFRHAAGAVVAGVGVLAIAAAVTDCQTGRIPNRLVGVAGLVSLAGVALVPIVDDRSLGDVVAAGLFGVALSGAVLVGAAWVLRPGVIGGGDVKLLGVLGFTVGLLAPVAAGLVLPVAALVAGVQAVVSASRRVVLGPGLSGGYIAAVAAAVLWNRLLGGRY